MFKREQRELIIIIRNNKCKELGTELINATLIFHLLLLFTLFYFLCRLRHSNTESVHVKFVAYYLTVSHHPHVCNCLTYKQYVVRYM